MSIADPLFVPAPPGIDPLEWIEDDEEDDDQ